MMKEHIINTLKEARDNQSWVKLMFIYPQSKPIFNQGTVVEVYEDSFLFNDRYSGDMEFGFTYLERVQVVSK